MRNVLFVAVSLFLVCGCSNGQSSGKLSHEALVSLWGEKEFELISVYSFKAQAELGFIANVRVEGRGRNFQNTSLLVLPREKHVEELGCSYAVPVGGDLVEMTSRASGQGTWEEKKELAFYDGREWVSVHSAASSSNEGYGCNKPSGVGCNVEVVMSDWYYRTTPDAGQKKMIEVVRLQSWTRDGDGGESPVIEDIRYSEFLLEGHSLKQIYSGEYGMNPIQ